MSVFIEKNAILNTKKFVKATFFINKLLRKLISRNFWKKISFFRTCPKNWVCVVDILPFCFQFCSMLLNSWNTNMKNLSKITKWESTVLYMWMNKRSCMNLTKNYKWWVSELFTFFLFLSVRKNAYRFLFLSQSAICV